MKQKAHLEVNNREGFSEKGHIKEDLKDGGEWVTGTEGGT